MTDRRKPQISSRKQPKQARSNELVAVVLEAAIQVLAKEGAEWKIVSYHNTDVKPDVPVPEPK